MRSARAVRHTGRRDSTCQSDAATVGGSRGAESRTGGNRAKPDAAAAKVADLVVLDLDTVPAAAPLQVSARATRHGAPRGRGRRGPATRVAARRVVRKRLRGRARPDHHPAEGVDLYNGGGLQGCPRGVSRPRWAPAFEQRRSRPGCVRHAAPFCSTCGTSLQEARLERETRNSRGRTARPPCDSASRLSPAWSGPAAPSSKAERWPPTGATRRSWARGGLTQ